MPTRIAHLSDLHYGKAFDIDIWRSVAKAVQAFDPDLLIVSGDLVDDPREDHLRFAKKELEDLAAASNAELFVVPGNHDLFLSGVDLAGDRSVLYYNVFDGTAADPAAEGFVRRPVSWTFWDRTKVWLGFGPHGATLQPPSPAPDGIPPTMLRQPKQAAVLLALIDSNAADQTIRVATGSVRTGDLTALDAELTSLSAEMQTSGATHFARIAVIHHHILPIAYTTGSLVGAEPFMVLHNAGDVLDLLVRHQFDLVLHGHKHRAQFARIDLSPDSAEGYPIAVAGAGSAALKTPNNPLGNSFNLITIRDNGRIDVESLHYGAGSAPNRTSRKDGAVKKYTENIESTKRRAFIRAQQRYPVTCRKRVYHFDVSELGDFTLTHHTIGLRALRGNGEYRKRRHFITIPEHGRLACDLQLDDTSRAAGYTIEPVPRDAQDKRRLVVLPQPLDGESDANYVVSHACANAVIMTRWESEQRARADAKESTSLNEDWFQVGVGCNISHPVEELHFKVSLPPGLSEVRPYLRCDRQSGFPNFKVNDLGDAEWPANPVYDIDSEMEVAEGRSPHFDPKDGMWHLVVHRPVVGYRYRIRWQTPGICPPEPVPGHTLQWREMLLQMVDRPIATEADQEAQRVFGVLADEFKERLAWGGRDEYWTIELFVYDAEKLGLRPVSRRSSQPLHDKWREFVIPLGDGIAGAAFQRRSIVPWAKQVDGNIFIEPVNDPDLAIDLRAILAIPVYHPVEEDKARPSPWGAIGVVSFGSSSTASKVPALLNSTASQSNEDLVKVLRGLAQSHVHLMLTALGQPTQD